MAAISPALDHLSCAICTEIFTEPVILSCQHTFCRACVHQLLNANHQRCPECNAPIVEQNFQSHRIVHALVEQLKLDAAEHERARAHRCPEHPQQELTLFCPQDGKMVCLVCRDGRQHAGHSFRPVEEEGAEVKSAVSSALALLSADICEVSSYHQRQRREIAAAKVVSLQMKTQISFQFEELRLALRHKEAEECRKVEEKSGLGAMETNLAAMEGHLAEARARLAALQYGLDTADPRDVLVWWKAMGGGREVRGKLASPSGCFPRLTLLQNRLVALPGHTLVPYTDWRRLELCLAQNMGSVQRRWVNPLFGNMWDHIRGVLWRWAFGRFYK